MSSFWRYSDGRIFTARAGAVVEPEPSEEERLIREIVRNFTALFDVRQKGEGAG
jgi:hypothetical protein